jgi:LuxR family transcriptional regulator, quorum-sensing system regulator BjaR1
MSGVVVRVMEMVHGLKGAKSALAASQMFRAAIEKDLPVSGFLSRIYRVPSVHLDSASLWRANGFVETVARPGWIGSPGHRYVCVGHNPLLRAVEQRRKYFRWSDLAPHRDRTHGQYWDAMQESGAKDGIGAITHGPARTNASLSIGLSDSIGDPSVSTALELAAQALTARLLELAEPQDQLTLSPREREVMAMIADGKSDMQAAAALNMSASTVRNHATNARIKLGATTRAEAIAIFVMERKPA